MHTLSVKELHSKFPFVKSELEKGTSFLIIYNSKPIAQLKPLKIDDGEIEMDEDEKAMLEDFQNTSAHDIAKHIPPITKEEYDYYMSLPPYKD